MKWLILFFLPTLALAKVQTQKIIYEKNGVKMEGLVAYDDKFKGTRPAVLVFHDWMGNGEYTAMRARQIAELGYFAFAADVYGQGVRPKNNDEASKLASRYRENRTLMRERAQAAYESMLSQSRVDKNKTVAIGYCFGGTVALELARDGAQLSGVVSFHGGLGTPMKATSMKPKVLALHGADDPYVKAEEVMEFEQEMRGSKADWQLVKYGNAVHAFTIKSVGNDPSTGLAYNELADKRSWVVFKNFLKEIF